jgi:hypothetical protein
MDTLRDLIDALEGLAAEYGDDLQPRIATGGLRAPQEFPIQDVDVIEVDGMPGEAGETRGHILYLVPDDIGEALAFEARRVFRG